MPKAGWNTILHLGSQASLAGQVAATHVIGLTNDIHMGPTAPEIVAPDHVRDGTSVLNKKYVQAGKISPTYTGAQTPLTASTFQWLMASLMNSSSEEAAGTLAHAPYTVDTPIVWYTFRKDMEAVDANSLEIEGCTVNRLAIDAPADGIAQVTFDFMGMIERISAAGITTSTPITGVGILTKDAVVTWDGDAYNQINGSFEFTNNAFFDHQQAQSPVSIKLGPLGLTGTLNVEWDEAVANALDVDCRAGYDSANEFELSWTWGTDTVDGYLKITCMVYISGQPGQTEGDSYQRLSVPWTMVSGTLTPAFSSSAAVPFDMVP